MGQRDNEAKGDSCFCNMQKNNLLYFQEMWLFLEGLFVGIFGEHFPP
jgi:hypothetical protein